MNIYEKINNVKLALLTSNLKKTGLNKHSNFRYYELDDILPTITKLCAENKLCTAITFDTDVAALVIINVEQPEEVITVKSPMKEISIAGCNPIQSLGGVETYQRRYLYLAAFDITEPELFDSIAGSPDNEEKITQEQVDWLTANTKVDELLNYIKKPSLLSLTKREAQVLIDAKKSRMEQQ